MLSFKQNYQETLRLATKSWIYPKALRHSCTTTVNEEWTHTDLISIWQELDKSVETGVGDLFDGRRAPADGLDGGGNTGSVVAGDIRLELAKNNPEQNTFSNII